jgi:hypothetical protein
MVQAIDEAFQQLNSQADQASVAELAKQFCAAHQGATKKSLQVLQPWI